MVNWIRIDSGQHQFWNLSLIGDWNSFTENNNQQDSTHELLTVAGQSLQHDAKGNQTFIPSILRRSDNSLTMSWDFENKLTSADTDEDGQADVEYQWDALLRRVARTADGETTVFVPSGQQTVADYRLGASPTTAKHTYVFGSYIDEPIMRGGEGGLRYYHRGQQYSVVALTNGGGSVTERYAYSAYGEPTFFDGNGVEQATSSEDNRYTYTGREWDEVLDLYHYRARIYLPRLGRFGSKDPISYGGGIHLYAYVSGKPLDMVDSTGFKCQPPTASGINYVPGRGDFTRLYGEDPAKLEFDEPVAPGVIAPLYIEGMWQPSPDTFRGDEECPSKCCCDSIGFSQIVRVELDLGGAAGIFNHPFVNPPNWHLDGKTFFNPRGDILYPGGSAGIAKTTGPCSPTALPVGISDRPQNAIEGGPWPIGPILKEYKFEAEACVVCLSGVEGPKTFYPDPLTLKTGESVGLTTYGCFKWGFHAKRQSDGTYDITRTLPTKINPTQQFWKNALNFEGPNGGGP